MELQNASAVEEEISPAELQNAPTVKEEISPAEENSLALLQSAPAGGVTSPASEENKFVE